MLNKVWKRWWILTCWFTWTVKSCHYSGSQNCCMLHSSFNYICWNLFINNSVPLAHLTHHYLHTHHCHAVKSPILVYAGHSFQSCHYFWHRRLSSLLLLLEQASLFKQYISELVMHLITSIQFSSLAAKVVGKSSTVSWAVTKACAFIVSNEQWSISQRYTMCLTLLYSLPSKCSEWPFLCCHITIRTAVWWCNNSPNPDVTSAACRMWCKNILPILPFLVSRHFHTM